MDEVVAAVTNLLSAGKARAWAVVNWPAERIAEARALASPEPCAAQLPYNLAQRSPVEDEDMIEALGPMGVVASFVLVGGALTGKYPGEGRLSGELENPRYAAALREAERLRAVRDRHDGGRDRVRGPGAARGHRARRRHLARAGPRTRDSRLT